MDEIIKKIDKEIEKQKSFLSKIDLIENPISACASNNQIYAFEKAKQIIQSSQKDLSQILTDIYNEYPYKIVGRCDTYSKYNEAWTDAVNRVAEAIGIDF